MSADISPLLVHTPAAARPLWLRLRVLRFPWRWRVIPSELIICRLHRHPQGNCRSVLRECIELPMT